MKDEARERNEASEKPEMEDCGPGPQWELTSVGDYNEDGSVTTRRMSVPGGWLVWVSIVHKVGGFAETLEVEIHTSVTFVADKEHSWNPF